MSPSSSIPQLCFTSCNSLVSPVIHSGSFRVSVVLSCGTLLRVMYLCHVTCEYLDFLFVSCGSLCVMTPTCPFWLILLSFTFYLIISCDVLVVFSCSSMSPVVPSICVLMPQCPSWFFEGWCPMQFVSFIWFSLCLFTPACPLWSCNSFMSLMILLISFVSCVKRTSWVFFVLPCPIVYPVAASGVCVAPVGPRLTASPPWRRHTHCIQ